MRERVTDTRSIYIYIDGYRFYSPEKWRSVCGFVIKCDCWKDATKRH